ncbi:MAG TPA: hypothetical protein PLH57_03955, partial [Oligoflexia bacterium]|nr:hypothetical protein [Oligoflexia bacterium]
TKGGFSRFNLTVLATMFGAFGIVGCVQPELVDDAAVSTAPAVVTPAFTIVSVPDLNSSSATGTFNFTYVPSDASVTCYVDADPAAPCISPHSFNALADGAHTANFSLNGGAATYTYTWTVDTAAPGAPAAVLASSTPTANSAATITIGSCAGISHIFVNEGGVAPSAGAAGWQTCSTVAAAITYTLTTNGNRTLNVWAKDSANNVSATSTDLAVTFDNVGPTIVITEPDNSDALKGGANFDVTWTATDTNMAANTITIDYSTDSGTNWTNIVTNTANDGTYTWAVPALNTANVQVRITAVDSLGNSDNENSTGNFIDSTAPTLTAAQMSLAAGAATTTSQYVAVDLAGSDNLTNITEFCLKYNSTTTPTAAASCWVPVTANPPGLVAAQTLTLDDYSFGLGFVGGAYTVYAWLKDAAGNISTLSNAGAGTDAQDRDDITYSPGQAPTVVDIAVVDSDPLPAPITSTDTAFELAGDFVYIHWDASDDGAAGSISIDLLYTTNDSTWTQFATGLAYNDSTNCTVAAGRTGCYRWALPGALANTYFRIRVKATDATSMVSYTNSNGLNVWPPINYLAGNTEPGTGASASAAVFFNNTVTSSVPDVGSMVVASNGTIYFRDIYRGILRILPTDGVVSIYIPLNSAAASNNGDGGAATSATVKDPLKIALDFSDRLLIWDDDRIRRVETNGTINTLIGGGAAADSNGMAPTDVQFTAQNYATTFYAPFYILPNGDLYFASGTSTGVGAAAMKYKLYDASSNTVSIFSISGTGDRQNVATPVADCFSYGFGVSFDAATSNVNYIIGEVAHGATYGGCTLGGSGASGVRLDASGVSVGGVITNHPTTNSSCIKVTGRDGKLYCVSRLLGRIQQYDDTARAWTTVIGTSTVGYCADGTAATSCNIEPHDLFVTQNGTMFFVDRGKIRAVDTSGNVVTVAGQGFNYGDGGEALSARFGTIPDIALWDDAGTDKVILLDSFNYRFREFAIGGTISTIAGNGTGGTPSTGAAATGQPLTIGHSGQIFDLFEADATGAIYFNRTANYIAKMPRSGGTAGQWVNLVGGGATSYTTAVDTTLGANISLSGTTAYPAVIIGNDGTNILTAFGTYTSPSHVNAMVHAYAMSDGAITRGGGVIGAANSTFCAVGNAVSGCNVPMAHGGLYRGSYWDPTAANWVIAHANYPTLPKTFPIGGNLGDLVTLPRSFSAITGYHPDGLTHMLYYCSGGRLYKYNMLTTTETALTWPVASMSCAGKQLIYSPAADRNSLIFIYTQANMYGIAEYLNP